jgi:hypothetical protein
VSVGAAELAGNHGVDSRRERVHDEELGLAAKLAGFFASFMSGNTAHLGVGLAQTSPIAAAATGLIGRFVAGVVGDSTAGAALGLPSTG